MEKADMTTIGEYTLVFFKRNKEDQRKYACWDFMASVKRIRSNSFTFLWNRSKNDYLSIKKKMEQSQVPDKLWKNGLLEKMGNLIWNLLWVGKKDVRTKCSWYSYCPWVRILDVTWSHFCCVINIWIKKKFVKTDKASCQAGFSRMRV